MVDGPKQVTARPSRRKEGKPHLIYTIDLIFTQLTSPVAGAEIASHIPSAAPGGAHVYILTTCEPTVTVEAAATAVNPSHSLTIPWWTPHKMMYNITPRAPQRQYPHHS